MYEIVERQEMAKNSVILNKIKAPTIARQAWPGQFVILRVDDSSPSMPLTITETDPSKGLITIIYQVLGKPTSHLKNLKVGDSYLSIDGPMGKPAELKEYGNVVCIGCGAGVAGLYPIARALKDLDNNITSIIGARTRDKHILVDKMTETSNQLFISTDDGSYGYHGFVTEVLVKVLEKEDIKLVFGVGPLPLVQEICSITSKNDIETMVNLYPIVIKDKKTNGCCYLNTSQCMNLDAIEGPLFNSRQIDFNELKKKLKKEANAGCPFCDAHVHLCNIVNKTN